MKILVQKILAIQVLSVGKFVNNSKVIHCSGQCIELGAGGYKCYCAETNFYGDNCQFGK